MGSPLSADQLETLLRGKWSFWDEYCHEITRLFETMDITFTPVPSKPRTPPTHPSAPSASLAQTSATPMPPCLKSRSRRCSVSYTTVSHALHACSIPSTAP